MSHGDRENIRYTSLGADEGTNDRIRRMGGRHAAWEHSGGFVSEGTPAPRIEEFDPQAAVPDDPAPVYLSPMEALLLDIALAPAVPEHAWLTFAQAEALFGRHAAEERAATTRERQRRAVTIAVAAITAALGAGLNAVNQMLDDPLLSDAAGVIAGAVLTATAALLWAVIGERTSIGSGGPATDERPGQGSANMRSR
jgi:hypothetical protein